MTRQSVFFDLDGTLTDPKQGITRCIQHALTAMDVAEIPHADELEWCIGPPLRTSFVHFVGEQRADEAVALYRQRFAQHGLFENEVYAGVQETLQHLAADGLQLFVASSKPEIYVRRILQHFALHTHFKGIYGSELDGTRADKSDLLAYALDDAGVSAAGSVMIGDRRHDAVGAMNNNMQFVGVLYGYGGRRELSEAGATVLAAAPLELKTLLT